MTKLGKLICSGIAVCAFALPSLAAMAATVYVQASVAGGVVIVSTITGNITFCPGLISGNTGRPIGVCTAIGQISTSNLPGNVQINAGSAAYDTVFVTNTATGTFVQCGLYTNGNNGVPFGGCSTHQAH